MAIVLSVLMVAVPLTTAASLGQPEALGARDGRDARAEGAPTQSLRDTPPASLPERFSVYFEENLGQADSSVHFIARSHGATLWFLDREVVMALPRAAVAHDDDDTGQDASLRDVSPQETDVLRIQFETPATPQIDGMTRLSSVSNYLIGRDASGWHEDVPHFERIQYEGMWPGIDVEFYFTSDGEVEFDFVVEPGADVEVIQFAIDGARRVFVDQSGDLLMDTGYRLLRQAAPVAFQPTGGAPIAVDARYVMDGSAVHLDVGDYDREIELIIDPVIAYQSYFGGSSTELGLDVVSDAAGAMYIVGRTSSLDLPTSTGVFQPNHRGEIDGFVAKLSPQGLAFVTYLGASDDDIIIAVALDSSGNIVLAGNTQSPDFPVSVTAYDINCGSGSQWDIFVTKLDAAGSRMLYSTCLGGESSVDEDFARRVLVDEDGLAVIVGASLRTGFPTTPGAYIDATQLTDVGAEHPIAAKLSDDGSELVWSTFLTRASAAAVDAAWANSRLTVIGQCFGTNCPSATSGAWNETNGDWDAFLLRLTPDGGAADYVATFGGSKNDFGRTLSVNGDGDALIAGETTSRDFPITPEAYQNYHFSGNDAFVAHIGSFGQRLWATYLGASGTDSPSAIVDDAGGNVWLAGFTNSDDFPVLGEGEARNGWDTFLARLSPDGTDLLDSGYLASPPTTAMRFDESGSLGMGGSCSGGCPTTPDAHQSSSMGGWDAYVARLDDVFDPSTTEPSPDPALAPSSPQNLEAETGPSSGTVALTWDAPASNGGLPVTNYRVYHGTTPSQLTLVSEIGNVQSFLHDGALAGINYYRVSAVNGGGMEGPKSSEASAVAIAGVVVGFGDSIAAGHGHTAADGTIGAIGFDHNSPFAYPSRVATVLGYASYNFAISGACAGRSDLGATNTPLNCTNTDSRRFGSDPTTRGHQTSVRDQIAEAVATAETYPQILAPSLITLTVGANDIEFGRCMEAVFKYQEGDPAHDPCAEPTLSGNLAAYRTNLRTSLDEIRLAFGGDVPVRLTQYYNPMPEPVTDSSEEACGIWLRERFTPLPAAGEPGRETWMRARQAHVHQYATGILDQLDSAMLDVAVRVVQETGMNLRLVPLRPIFAADGGHDMCRAERDGSLAATWVFSPTVFNSDGEPVFGPYPIECLDRRLDPADTFVEPFGILLGSLRVNCTPHPTVHGHFAIADAVIARIS